MVNKPNGLYNFLTDSWQNLLADENDILLSEINVNKRGRNKDSGAFRPSRLPEGR